MSLLRLIWDSSTEEEPEGTGERKAPRDVDGWCDEAEQAEESGEWSRAVVCYRRALQLAPFNREIKELFAEAVAEQIRSSERAKGRVRRAPVRLSIPRIEDTPEATEEPLPPPPTRRRARRRGQGRPLAELLRPLAFSGAIGLVALLVVGVGALGVSASVGFVRGLFGEASLPSATVTRQLPPAVTDVIVAANELVVEGRPDEAAGMLRDAQASFGDFRDVLDPALAQVLRATGAAEARAHRHEAAATAYREAAQLHPENTLTWIDLGRALREHARSSAMANRASDRQRLLSEAEESYLRALELSGGHSQALLGLAQVYDAGNQRGKAVETYEKLVNDSPETLEGQMARSALQQLRGR